MIARDDPVASAPGYGEFGPEGWDMQQPCCGGVSIFEHEERWDEGGKSPGVAETSVTRQFQ